MLWLVMQGLERRFRHLSILTAAVLLTGTGLFFIASTCYAGEAFQMGTAWRGQLQWWCLALLVCVAFALADFRSHGALVGGGYLVFLGLLVATLLGGETLNGATRSLSIFGAHSFQTGIPARLFTILAFSAWLARPPIRMAPFWHGVVGVLLVLVPALLIAIQPAMGNAMVLVLTCTLVWVVHRANPHVVKWGVLAAILAFALLVPTLAWVRRQNIEPARVEKALAWWPYRHHRQRLAQFLDPYGDRGNEQQIGLCLRSGGAWGKGWFRGDIQNGGFLPHGVAGSDYIIATIGEEAGFLGCSSVLALCVVLVVLCLRIGAQTTDPWGRLVCAGIAFLFASQVLISVGMALRLCPIIGLTIPFVGRGGTLLVAAYMGLGIVMSIQRFTVQSLGTIGEQTICEVHPPREIMYREDPDTVVIDLFPYGPMKLLLRMRWERAAATLELRGHDALTMNSPKPRRRRERKPKSYRKGTYEFPGFRDLLFFRQAPTHDGADREREDDEGDSV